MIAKVLSSCVVGIDAYPIEVEVEVGSGLPAFGIVGLPDTACRESQERVRSAIRNSGYSIPMRKVTVNLAPAGIKKEGAFFDLPIAIGILAASEQIPSEALAECVLAGELALDGKVRTITGILSRITAAPHAGKRFIFPQANLREAACVEGARLYPVRHLCEAVSALAGEGQFDRASVKAGSRAAKAKKYDFADVKGQIIARRGIEIAVAGGHNLLTTWTQCNNRVRVAGQAALDRHVQPVSCPLVSVSRWRVVFSPYLAEKSFGGSPGRGLMRVDVRGKLQRILGCLQLGWGDKILRVPEPTSIKGEIELQVYSQFLKRQVALRKETWVVHILPRHPELKGKLHLVKQIIEDTGASTLRFRRKNNPLELALFLKCEHFRPHNTHLKVALKIISDSEAIVTTAEGYYEPNIPPLGMEKI